MCMCVRVSASAAAAAAADTKRVCGGDVNVCARMNGRSGVEEE